MSEQHSRRGFLRGAGLAAAASTTFVPAIASQALAAPGKPEDATLLAREIAGRGGWGTLPTGLRLKLGARGKGVVALRQRLLASGDLGQEDNVSDTYDSFGWHRARPGLARAGYGRE